MCGRYFLISPPEALQRTFGLATVPAELVPRYNIAPTQRVPIIVNHQGERVLGLVRWGLVPEWAATDDDAARNINARAETVAERPSFRDAFRLRRCLVPADGFYEWRRAAGRGRSPVAVRIGDETAAFAGLWERWRAPGGQLVTTCTILTTEADPSIRAIHDRMPVILDPQAQRTWLDPDASPEALLALLAGVQAPPLAAHTVSTAVNSVAVDGPECLAPAPEPPELDLFG